MISVVYKTNELGDGVLVFIPYETFEDLDKPCSCTALCPSLHCSECSHTRSMDEDEGSDQNLDLYFTGLVKICIYKRYLSISNKH